MSAGPVPPAGPIAIGDVVTVELPRHAPSGHEQEGYRPAIVVGLPAATGMARFPSLAIVPVTTDRGQPWAAANARLYPTLPAGAGGLRIASIALVDQVRTIDQERLRVQRGTLGTGELRPIQDGLRAMLGL